MIFIAGMCQCRDAYEYHYRSGSTKQQLRGASLTEFLVEKTGYRWDAVPVDNIGVEDLDSESFDIFRREAVRTGRMSKDDLNISNEELLDHLDLLVDGKLKRAATMLFYKKPGRIISGCYVKIGKFGKGSDLQYQDTVEGSLFRIADRVIDLIYTKYLKAVITYEHDVRVETYPFPREGVREVIYNALGHNNYAASVPIQIRIEDEAMYISNNCILPRGWTVETLMGTHKSVPFNPSIANAFYRAGYIEAWGRGIQKVLESCKELGSPEPEYTVLGDDLTVKFTALPSAVIPNEQSGGNAGGDGGKNGGNGGDIPAGLNETERIVYLQVRQNGALTAAQMSEALGLAKRTVERTLSKLREKDVIIRIGSSRSGKWEIRK